VSTLTNAGGAKEHGNPVRGIACLDGELMPFESARVSPFDHGFLYGDGLFETLRVYGGHLFRLDEHLNRLREGIETLQIAGTPPTETIASWTKSAVDAAATTAADESADRQLRGIDAYCRITVTRGIGTRGLDPLSCERATVLVAVLPLRLPAADRYERGVKATVLWARSHDDLPPLTVKSTNYQRAVLASLELRRRGVDEGFFLDRFGHVVETTTANVFAVVDGRLVTPPADACLAGITRAEILSIASELGVGADVAPLPLELVRRADEVFLTSSIAEIVPVVALDGEPIGSGVPGLMVRRLHDAFGSRTRIT
jgi:branched-chain amino acid aminotransferase